MIEIRRIVLVILTTVLVVSMNEEDQPNTKFPFNEKPGNSMYDFFVGKMKFNELDCQEVISQLTHDSEIISNYQDHMADGNELRVLFPSSYPIIGRRIPNKQSQKIIHCPLASKNLYSGIKAVLALYGIKIHNLARVVVGPFCISVWLWGESYKSFLTRNWKLLTLVLSFMREHGFQALAASVARFLLDKIYDYRCVTINLNFVLKQECEKCLIVDTSKPVAKVVLKAINKEKLGRFFRNIKNRLVGNRHNLNRECSKQLESITHYNEVKLRNAFSKKDVSKLHVSKPKLQRQFFAANKRMSKVNEGASTSHITGRKSSDDSSQEKKKKKEKEDDTDGD